MIKITKTYTIKFSYGGVSQYAEFRESNGELVYPSLMVSWAKAGEIPDISQLKNIDEILAVIKKFAYGNRAEIYLINGVPIFYFNKEKTKALVNEMVSAMEVFIENQIKTFFYVELKPLLKKNRWKITSSQMNRLVLIEKVKGEWDNIKNSEKEFEFEYLCYKCLSALNLTEPIKLNKEHGNNIYESHKLFSEIYEEITNSEFYLDLSN